MKLRILAGLFIVATASSSRSLTQPTATEDSKPARLAIYYGYPSLVNGSLGDVEKAARVFARYRVVVLGDGIEFPDRQPNRDPQGDPAEHKKAAEIMVAVHQLNPRTELYGYVCLGDVPSRKSQPTALTPNELKDRIRLWKQMGVKGIFLDEAGYDFPAVTRYRQNMAIQFVHELGMSAFVNAYFPEHLFSQDDLPANSAGAEKNPDHAPTLLDSRDVFLLESFQVKNGQYEDPQAWQPRIQKALTYRRRFGTRIFATSTTEPGIPFDVAQFDYAWWTASLYDLDGFAWGEPDFSARDNSLPDRHGGSVNISSDYSSIINSSGRQIWRRSRDYVVVLDISKHSVRRVPAAAFAKRRDGAATGDRGATLPLGPGNSHELQAN
jgi:hypothetical protein